MSVTDHVLTLAGELREAGAPVSVAETTDAMEAVLVVGMTDRDALRQALATTLVKDPSRLDLFDRLFDVLFPAPRSTAPVDGTSAPGEADMQDTESRLSRAVREMDPEALRAIAEQLVEQEAGVDPNARVSDEHYRYRALRGLDLDDLLRRVVEEDVAGRGMGMLERRLVEEEFDQRMDAFKEQIAEEVRRRRRQGLDLGQQIRQEHRQVPEEVDFLWAKHGDLTAMRAALQPLGRRLALRLSHRRRKARRGRLDVRRTVRRSLSTGGVLIEPRFRRPSAGKPELWIVCDISGSMRSFARFTLELVYVLSTQFQRVRSFAFVDALDEITDKLEVADDLSGALDRIDAEAKVVSFDGQSWYGNSLEQLWVRAGRELSARTSVLILGDARNNFRTTGVDALREIKRNCRTVWWLNPEPKQYWNSADSAVAEFESCIGEMFECRNLTQLESFVARAL